MRRAMVPYLRGDHQLPEFHPWQGLANPIAKQANDTTYFLFQVQVLLATPLTDFCKQRPCFASGLSNQSLC
jgi:hypothetical protein